MSFKGGPWLAIVDDMMFVRETDIMLTRDLRDEAKKLQQCCKKEKV
jgi:hypothetical protein